jgi:acyl-homoserine lactone acylase PvdQ
MSFDWDDSSGFRATRIDERLADTIAQKGAVSLDDMESIQADHVSRPGKAFTEVIANIPAAGTESASLTAARALFTLWAAQGWDCPSGLLGSDPVNSATDPDPINATNSNACFLFHEFARVVATNVFTDDLAVAGQGVNGLQAIKTMLYMLDPNTPATDKAFCNNVNASGTTIGSAIPCEAQVLAALETAYDTLTAELGDSKNWVWGRVHIIQPVSLLQLVTTNYSPGPYARPGGIFTVDVGSPSLSGSGLDFQYFSGGNVRHISVMDQGNPIVKMQLPGPERDAPALFVGPDLLGQWVTITYFDFAFGSQIDAAAVSTQSFTAQ